MLRAIFLNHDFPNVTYNNIQSSVFAFDLPLIREN